MKKWIFILVAIIIIVVVTLVFFNMNNEPFFETKLPNDTSSSEEKSFEIDDLAKIEKIKSESYLNILLSIRVFDKLNRDYKSLLVAAMRIAGEQGLLDVSEDGIYTEYVPKSTIHDIIFELSGIRVNDPIALDEDFYYRYDEEGDYYYVVPTSPDWLLLKDIKKISYNDETSEYTINCSATTNNLEDAENLLYENAVVKLTYKASNKYCKYTLTSVNIGKAS